METNRTWFSVVCTLIDNDIRHHSGQNVVDSRGAAYTTFDLLISELSLRKSRKRQLVKMA